MSAKILPILLCNSASIRLRTESKTKDGKVDLEDTMAIARLGAEKVSEAQRISTSLDYRVYRDAKYADGKPIISKKEQRFINQWLAYYHADID